MKNPEADPAALLPWRQKFRLRLRNWEHGGRNRLLALLRAALLRRHGEERLHPPGDAAFWASAIRRVLIVRTGRALGDAVMSLVLVPECRRLFPSAHVDLLLRDNVSPLFLEGAGADDVLELHPRFLKWPVATARLLRRLRSARYDIAIACDNPLKSSLTALCLGLWTGARWRVGFDNEESRAFLNTPVPPLQRGATVANLLRLLSPFGNPSLEALPFFSLPSRFYAKAAQVLGEGGDPILIFAPNHWRKSWPLDAWVRLARELTARKHRVILAFGPGDARNEDPLAADWARASNGLGGVMPPQRLEVFAAVLSRVKRFISNDCGPYHMAVGVGARCVGVFLTSEACEDFGYERKGRLVRIYHPDPREAERLTLQAALEP